MNESFERTTPGLHIIVLAPHDLPAEAATWPPEKVTMYWLSGQPQAWRGQVRIGQSHDGEPGQWMEIDEPTAQRLHDCPEAELADLVSGW